MLERVDRYIQLLRELDLRLVKAIDTHLHADHITGLEALRERTRCITVMGEQTKADVVSIRVSDGDRVDIEGLSLEALYTPGHTDNSYSYILPDRVFSGDTLLIRGTGRTDFQNGDPRAQYDSLFGRLLKLPDETMVYPAHDYKGDTVSTIGEEKAFNPRLQVKSADDYAALMNGLNLPNPKMMDVAVPANMRIGLAQQIVAGKGWAVSAEEAKGLLDKPDVALIDLREDQERKQARGYSRLPACALCRRGGELASGRPVAAIGESRRPALHLLLRLWRAVGHGGAGGAGCGSCNLPSHSRRNASLAAGPRARYHLAAIGYIAWPEPDDGVRSRMVLYRVRLPAAAVAALCGALPLSSGAHANIKVCQGFEQKYEQIERGASTVEINDMLFKATDKGCQDLARSLLEAGASLEARDRLGAKPLSHAAAAGQIELVALFLDHGAAIDARDLDGSTAMFKAAESGRVEIVKLLAERGAQVDLPGRSAVTPLSAAAFMGSAPIVAFLIEKGADPNWVDGTQKAPIVYAVGRAFPAVCTVLLEHGVDVNAKYGNDLTALMWAAGYSAEAGVKDAVDVMTLFIDHGARLDDQDNRGRTALMIAAELNHAAAVDLLLARGADKSLKDKQGKTAADLTSLTALREKLAAR